MILCSIIPGGGAGLPVRPFRRHDFFKVTGIFTELTRSGDAGLTSEKAAATLHKYAQVVPTAQVTRLHIADASPSRICFRMYYGNGRTAEFIVMKSSSAAVTNIFRKTFGNRFYALLTTDLPEGALPTTDLPEGAIPPVAAYQAPLPDELDGQMVDEVGRSRILYRWVDRHLCRHLRSRRPAPDEADRAARWQARYPRAGTRLHDDHLVGDCYSSHCIDIRD